MNLSLVIPDNNRDSWVPSLQAASTFTARDPSWGGSHTAFLSRLLTCPALPLLEFINSSTQSSIVFTVKATSIPPPNLALFFNSQIAYKKEAKIWGKGIAHFLPKFWRHVTITFDISMPLNKCKCNPHLLAKPTALEIWYSMNRWVRDSGCSPHRVHWVSLLPIWLWSRTFVGRMSKATLYRNFFCLSWIGAF